MKEFKKPLVSLIITCHNLGRYLGDCVKSIENQTYKNFEIIIVDDNSDDETKEIIEKNFKSKSVIAKFFNSVDIRLLQTKDTKGQLSAFLEGLKAARGEFVCMIDADDVLFEDYLSTHLQVHMSTNVAFTSSAQAEINQDGAILSLCSNSNPLFKNEGGIEKKLSADEIFNPEKKDFEIKVLTQKKYPFGRWAWNPSTSAMMRKSALDFLLLFNDVKNYKTGADKLVFSFLHLIGGSALISAPLYAYRRHSCNQSAANPLIGNFRYLKSSQIERIIRWNSVLRVDTLKFLFSNYGYFCTRLNPQNTKRLILRTIFSFDFQTIKKALKALCFKLS